MLTDYEKIEGDKFHLDLINQEGVRIGETFMVDLALVKPFIDMVQRRNLGSHESILVGYMMHNGPEDHLFIVGKTMTMKDGKFTAEHWNYHEKRGAITKTHETQITHADPLWRLLSVFYEDIFVVIDKDIPATLQALRRLYITREVWQSYDCPNSLIDLDLCDDCMVHIGQEIPCSACDENHIATAELVETFERNGEDLTYPETPITKEALELFKKNT
jgi:hypothetical protein